VGAKTTFDCDLSGMLDALIKDASSGGSGAGSATDGTGGTLTWKISGGFTVADQDDTKKYPLAGFSFSYDDYRMILSGLPASSAVGGTGAASPSGTAATDGASVGFELAINGHMKVNVEGGVFKGEHKFKTAVASGEESTKVVQWLDSTAKPDDAAAPLKGGAVSFSGYIQSLDKEGNETNIKVSTKDLIYREACGKEFGGYESGTITYEAAEGKLEYVFSACKGTLKLDGKAL
jgi:hypothetical protein